MKKLLCYCLLSFILMACKEKNAFQVPPFLTIEDIAIPVTAKENREYSYTDKKAGYYYGRTHQDDFGEWFAGWNVAQKRIFSDYSLWVDGVVTDRMQAEEVAVYPHKLERKFAHLTEEFFLADNKEILFVRVSDVQGSSIGIQLHQGLLTDMRMDEEGVIFTPKEAGDKVVKVVPFHPCVVSVEGHVLNVPVAAGGFIIVLGEDSEVQSSIADFRTHATAYLDSRYSRMNRLIAEDNPVRSNLDSLDRAMAWLLLTTDQLITKQQGNGIYAGLPWFNEYWGRDMFISMPGACLVSGQFEIAKEIFSDFSRLQDTRPESKTLGRIPNRANMQGILYNTTDGTPRLISQIDEYIRYSGDTAYIREIYPVVKLSIEASVKNHTDDKGYLLHEDADTWMDVKRQGVPGSPRGNRANDIQALWYGQLRAGQDMAMYMGDEEAALKWQALADRLQENFEHDYADEATINIVDHLNAGGSADKQFRPNQLYAFELIRNDELKMKLTRKIWEELVYPWGTSSLSQFDDQFHPQHENWHYYHKDDAYHNGTVWLWNNGHAMQRMIEMDQPEIAWNLFTNMNRQALAEGAVGSLSENADAHPREGQAWANRSGTFLQAWSNAEQLRVWYQYFIGMLPYINNPDYPGLITLTPKLPGAITNLYWKERVGNGHIEGIYRKEEARVGYTYRLSGMDGHICVQLAQFPELTVPVRNGQVVEAVQQGEELNLRVLAENGDVVYTQRVHASEELKALTQHRDAFFQGTHFAVPVKRENLKAFDTYHEKALTY